MALSTHVVAVNATGEAVVYQPPNVIPVSKGYNVVNGVYVPVPAGDDWPSGPGTYQVGNGSGNSTVVTAVTYRQVTITPL